MSSFSHKIYLVGHLKHQITGRMQPANGDLLFSVDVMLNIGYIPKKKYFLH